MASTNCWAVTLPRTSLSLLGQKTFSLYPEKATPSFCWWYESASSIACYVPASSGETSASSRTGMPFASVPSASW